MHFINRLPKSKGKTTIFVVVDWLSKYGHFLALQDPYIAPTMAQLFFENIFRLHGLPKTIVCDSNPTFTSLFRKELIHLQGTNFNFNFAYHPQMDGQTEIVNHTIEMSLWCFTGDYPTSWTTWLPWVEYRYNTSWHFVLRTTPIEVVYWRTPPTLISYLPGMTKVASIEEQLI